MSKPKAWLVVWIDSDEIHYAACRNKRVFEEAVATHKATYNKKLSTDKWLELYDTFWDLVPDNDMTQSGCRDKVPAIVKYDIQEVYHVNII
jgi:hypothetical protein